jgi:urea carboxylase-associated protein 1
MSTPTTLIESVSKLSGTFEGTVFRQVIEAGGRWSRRLETGERLRIIDLEGQQAVDFLCYAAALPMDRINIPNTVKLNKSLYITEGCTIYSDLARPLLKVVSDSCGMHDTLAGCCSNEIDLLRYGAVKTRSCRSNFIAELATWSMSPSEIVPNINFFMRVTVGPQGEVLIAPGISKAGDHVELQAQMPVIAMLSNCPQELNPASGFKPTPIEVIVYRPVAETA